MSAVLAFQDYSPVRIDWPQILADLYERKVTAYRIASLMNINQSTVRRWEKNGYEPGHSYGRALLAIHARFCGEALTTSRTALTGVSYKG